MQALAMCISSEKQRYGNWHILSGLTNTRPVDILSPGKKELRHIKTIRNRYYEQR